MKVFPTIILVVAGALQRGDRRWLMHRRPLEKHHGGLWEFPGGKVESGEMPRQALVRELKEELGIAVDATAVRPAAFAEGPGEDGNSSIVILLYSLRSWAGQPEPLEGGAIDWFDIRQMEAAAKPPLDAELLAALVRSERR